MTLKCKKCGFEVSSEAPGLLENKTRIGWKKDADGNWTCPSCVEVKNKF